MATIAKLSATLRSESGTTACRRLRRSGKIPANIYGHKQDPVPVSLDADAVRPIIYSGAQVVDLEIDGSIEKALIREVQWDTYSKYVRHLDFLRVDPNERVTVSVPLQLLGIPVGTQHGGILEQPLHTVQVECSAIQIPDVIKIRVSQLDVNDTLHVKDLADLAEGVTILDHPDAVVVHIGVAMVDEEETSTTEEGVVPSEPELITRESKDDEDAAEG